MFIIKAFDPSLLTVATDVETNSINSGAQLMLYNDSPIGLLIKLPDGSVDVLPPYWNKDFISLGAIGKVNFTPYNRLAVSSGYPISLVYGTLYEREERVASVNASMQRGVAITNSVATTGSMVATGITNDGNVAGTQIIEALVQGDSVSAVTLTNDGKFILGTAINRGTLLTKGALGNVTIDANGLVTIDWELLTNLIAAKPTNDLTLSNVSTQNIIQKIGLVNVTLVNSTGEVITGTLSVSALTTLLAGLAVTGAATFSSTVNVSGLLSALAGLAVTGAMTVSTTAQISGLLTLLAGLNVTGATTISGLLTSNGGLSISGAASTFDGNLLQTDNAGKLSGRIFAHDKNNANSGYYGSDSVAGSHKLLHINVLDDDTHLYSSSAHGNLKVSKSDSSADIAVFNDTAGLTVALGQIIMTGGVGIKFKTNDTVSGIHSFTGSGTGTYTHGAGGTPYIVMPIVSQVGSATQGYDTITATQVHITMGAVLSFKALTLLG